MNPKAWHKAQPTEQLFGTICMSLGIQDTSPRQQGLREEHTQQGCHGGTNLYTDTPLT